MTGEFTFYLSSFRRDAFFKPIRRKVDCILLLLNAIKFIGVVGTTSTDERCGFLLLHVNKMSRLFFCDGTGNKIFSINFPFVTQWSEANQSYQFANQDGYILDGRVTSDLIPIFTASNGIVNEDEFFEVISDAEEYRSSLASIVRELLTYESGYVRFDNDPDNEDGEVHPLNHIDVFFSQSSTFKLGLDNQIDHSDLIDILDRRTQCHFVRK